METTTTWVIVCRDHVFDVTLEEANRTRMALATSTEQFVDVSGMFLSRNVVEYILSREVYEQRFVSAKKITKPTAKPEQPEEEEKTVKLTDGTTVLLKDVLADQIKDETEREFVNANAGKSGKAKWERVIHLSE